MDEKKRFKLPLRRIWLTTFGLLTIALIGLAIGLQQLHAGEPLPILGEISTGSFINSEAQPYTLETLQGKVWVADFIFTTCAGPCPVLSKHMSSLHLSYRLEEDVRMVSFSVNPEYDTPQVMKAYADSHGADTRSWHFLTGSREEIHRVAVEEFKLGSLEDPVFHSTRFVLVDRKGQIRGYYEGQDKTELRHLFTDIARLLKEKV